jgi:hypothetical protein
MLDLAVRHEVKILVPFRISRFAATLLQNDAEAERSLEVIGRRVCS